MTSRYSLLCGLIPQLQPLVVISCTRSDNIWFALCSSVQLLGDLLYRISGVSGKMSTETADEDDNFGTEQSHHVSINSSVNFIPVRNSDHVMW